jgi:hypothetical protein
VEATVTWLDRRTLGRSAPSTRPTGPQRLDQRIVGVCPRRVRTAARHPTGDLGERHGGGCADLDEGVVQFDERIVDPHGRGDGSADHVTPWAEQE